LPRQIVIFLLTLCCLTVQAYQLTVALAVVKVLEQKVEQLLLN